MPGMFIKFRPGKVSAKLIGTLPSQRSMNACGNSSARSGFIVCRNLPSSSIGSPKKRLELGSFACPASLPHSHYGSDKSCRFATVFQSSPSIYFSRLERDTKCRVIFDNGILFRGDFNAQKPPHPRLSTLSRHGSPHSTLARPFAHRAWHPQRVHY